MLFDSLNLDPKLAKAVSDLGFTEMTEIQEKCIPEIRLGKDLVGQSSTGSGKTLAFGLPILEKIEKGKGIQVLILTPTRELCVQVCDAMNDFAKYSHIKSIGVFGGVNINPQIQELRFAEIVVGTPGRILDHTERGTINYKKIKFLVLDEADKMFEMGFVEDVEEIISHVPKERQTLLFSATIDSGIQRLVRKHLKDPVSVKGQFRVDRSLLKQFYYEVKREEKFSLLAHLLKQNRIGLSLIFTGTRREADIVARNLQKNGFDATAIHGGHAQNKRLRALESLRKGHISALVATDVAARGLDIKNVNYVYNYDVPRTSDEYIHRIGRTARAGEQGAAITLLCGQDHMNFRAVMRDRSIEIKREENPQFAIIPFARHQEHRGHFGGRGRRPSSDRGYGGHSRERQGYGGSSSGGYGSRSSSHGSSGYGRKPGFSGGHSSRSKPFGKRGGFNKRRNWNDPGRSDYGQTSH